MNKKLRSTLKESKEYKDVLKCPKCGFDYLHIIKVAVAPKGEIYHSNGETFQDGLTHRQRDKLITFLECENCNVPINIVMDPNTNETIEIQGDEYLDELIRIEVNHKGMTLSGIYHVKGGINKDNLNILTVYEND